MIRPKLVSACTLILALGLVMIVPLAAQEHQHQQQHEHPSPAMVVAEFHAALKASDSQAALDALAEDVMIFESGGVERSREEYASHHLGADAAFSAATERTILDQVKGDSGDIAWVLTRSETKGNYRGRAIDSPGVETMVLRRSGDGWKIIHIHWSSSS